MAATSAETGPGQVQGTDIKINGISHFPGELSGPRQSSSRRGGPTGRLSSLGTQSSQLPAQCLARSRRVESTCHLENDRPLYDAVSNGRPRLHTPWCAPCVAPGSSHTAVAPSLRSPRRPCLQTWTRGGERSRDPPGGRGWRGWPGRTHAASSDPVLRGTTALCSRYSIKFI